MVCVGSRLEQRVARVYDLRVGTAADGISNVLPVELVTSVFVMYASLMTLLLTQILFGSGEVELAAASHIFARVLLPVPFHCPVVTMFWEGEGRLVPVKNGVFAYQFILETLTLNPYA